MATVSNTGLVTGVAPGAVTITATAGGKSATAEITVVPIPVAEVVITPGTIGIGTGRSQQLVATALDAEGDPIDGVQFTWASDNPGGVTVVDGLVTAVTANTSAAITATADGILGAAQVTTVRPRLAYFWNDVPGGAGTWTPEPAYSHNSLGGTNQVTRLGAGRYSASFAGQTRMAWESEAIFVTAYSISEGGFCAQGNWVANALTLDCYNKDGVPVDAYFTVAHISSGTFPGRFGFGWLPNGGTSTNPDANYRFNSSGGQITGQRLGTGEYVIVFKGLGRKSANQREGVLVNAYGSIATCQPLEWQSKAAPEDELEIKIRCFGADGAPIDSRFTVLVVEQAREGGRLAFGLADQPNADSYHPTNSGVSPSGTVQVERLGTGYYVVEISDFHRVGDAAETYLVGGYGPNAVRCFNGGWYTTLNPDNPARLWVRCYDPDGVAVDAPFTFIGIQ